MLARRPESLVDFERRLSAVQAFIRLEPAASLAAANKRIANILKKAEQPRRGRRERKAVSRPGRAGPLVGAGRGEGRR